MSFWGDLHVTSGLGLCFSHSYRVIICAIFLLMMVGATRQFLEDSDSLDVLTRPDPIQSAEKRPARLSYFRAPVSSGRGRYGLHRGGSHRSYGYGQRAVGSFRKNEWWRKKAVNRYTMPWDRLPNTNCLRKYCRHNGDCCRRFSICNKHAHVCYDCWYGHPCRNHFDCCAQYPYCNPVLNTCGK